MIKKDMKQQGFTLIELMIVVAITAIISVISYASYKGSIIKTHRTDAQVTLMSFASALERYYIGNGSYTGSDDGLDVNGSIPKSTVFSSEAPLVGNTKFYDLRMTITPTVFTVFAVPKGMQIDDGKLKLSSTGERLWDKNNDGIYNVNW